MAEIDLSLTEGESGSPSISLDLNFTEGESGSSLTAPTIKVKIYNQVCRIRTDGDSEYLRELAEFVDRRMREISSGTLANDLPKVAILTALLIADELHRVKQAKRDAGPNEIAENPLSHWGRGLVKGRGLWKDRDDLPDFGQVRSEWDRL